MGGMAHLTRFIRTHGRRSIIAGVVVVALAVGGVAYAVAGSGGSATSQANPPATSAPTTAPPAPAAKRHPILRGLITAIAPGNWTVRTRSGQTIAVIVSAQTQFGSRRAPLTSSAFAVGDRILVIGPRTETTIVAARIAKAPVRRAGTTRITTSTTVSGPASTG
jgi:hypothetical protein